MAKKKILIHSIVFSPDGVSTAYLYNDIAKRFQEEGYEVIVLTTTPHYNVLKSELDKQVLKKNLFGLYYESDFQGIRVVHVTQKKYKNTTLRILGFIYWHILSLVLGLAQKNVSLILSPSPPLTIGVINLIIGKIKGAKVIYNVQEIYPDFLLNQGQLKFSPLISLLRGMERLVYNKSDATTTIDKVFYNTISPRFLDKRKLHIIPNFVDTNIYKPLAEDGQMLDPNYFAARGNSLKVMYAGNIGHAQSWEPLLSLAQLLLNENVEFWVIGEGVMKEYIEEQIVNRGLINIHIVPYQPRHLMPRLIAFADLHFIFMAKEMEGQGFPSKVYTIMACSKPLLIISGRETPIYHFLESLECAYLISNVVLTEQVAIMVDIISKNLNDKSQLVTMGKKGYEVIQRSYTSDKVTEQYVDLANQLLIA